MKMALPLIRVVLELVEAFEQMGGLLILICFLFYQFYSFLPHFIDEDVGI